MKERITPYIVSTRCRMFRAKSKRLEAENKQLKEQIEQLRKQMKINQTEICK